jgi:ferrous iron transport protein B
MRIALVGNPSVGKSLIFNQLTGVGVEVSNYPGTTVELKGGSTCFQREIVEIVDLPGIYSLEGEYKEEELVRTFLLGGEADAVVLVMDATKLERNLYLLLQVAELGIPMVAVLNMMDELAKEGYEIDTDLLEGHLGISVVPTAATLGQNVSRIVPEVLRNATPSSVRVPYDRSVEAAINSLERSFGAGRGSCIWTLVGLGTDAALLEAAAPIRDEIEARHRMTVSQIIAANRHNYAREIRNEVMVQRPAAHRPDLDQVLTSSITGIPILLITLIGILLVVFTLGTFLEETIVALFEQFAVEPIRTMGLPPLISAVLLAVVLAFQAGIGIALPFVFIFYVLLSILEDTGYLTRAAFLADSAMHRIGMHGGAIIPLMMGLGCNVPAIMGVRLLSSRRERLIAAFLITMVPCSARTVIVLGIVAAFLGILPALSIYFIVLALIMATGLVLSHYTPGQQFGLIMEMAPLRAPIPKYVLIKSWRKMKEFFFIAMPLLLVGSVFLGLFQYFGIMDVFENLIAPFAEGVLGIPSYAATALIFGILRKEMAFETLAVLAGTANLPAVMSGLQLYIFAIVSVLFIPCISTIAVLLREVGGRFTLAITAYTVSLGILIGALINYLAG